MKDRELRKALGYQEYSPKARNPFLKVSLLFQLKNDFEVLQQVCGDEIAKLKNRLDNQPIGEVYIESSGEMKTIREDVSENFSISFGGSVPCRFWQPFSRKDIDDQINGKIKIKGQWHDKKNCVFYNDVEKEKKKIEKQYK